MRTDLLTAKTLLTLRKRSIAPMMYSEYCNTTTNGGGVDVVSGKMLMHNRDVLFDEFCPEFKVFQDQVLSFKNFDAVACCHFYILMFTLKYAFKFFFFPVLLN